MSTHVKLPIISPALQKIRCNSTQIKSFMIISLAHNVMNYPPYSPKKARRIPLYLRCMRWYAGYLMWSQDYKLFLTHWKTILQQRRRKSSNDNEHNNCLKLAETFSYQCVNWTPAIKRLVSEAEKSYWTIEIVQTLSSVKEGNKAFRTQ